MNNIISILTLLSIYFLSFCTNINRKDEGLDKIVDKDDFSKCNDSIKVNNLLVQAINIKEMKQYFKTLESSRENILTVSTTKKTRSYSLDSADLNIKCVFVNDGAFNNQEFFLEFQDISLGDSTANVNFFYHSEGLEVNAHYKLTENKCNWRLISVRLVEK